MAAVNYTAYTASVLSGCGCGGLYTHDIVTTSTTVQETARAEWRLVIADMVAQRANGLIPVSLSQYATKVGY